MDRFINKYCLFKIMGFKEVCRDIKSLKIQGAMSIAIAGIKAMSMKGFDEKKNFKFETN